MLTTRSVAAVPDTGVPGQSTDRSVPGLAGGSRDRYIDTLRVLALGRVVAFHVTGWLVLPILFPSMGIMFALAGSLMAASLDRSPHNPWAVLRKRVRRLLPPLWALGLVLVPLMLILGWTAQTSKASEFGWSTVLAWLVPLSDPPGSDIGADWVLPLWYIRAYLWFVLLSPVMLWCFRRWPVRTFLTPLLLLGGYGAGLVALHGPEGDVVLKWAVFGSCWVLGFAHHDQLIRRIPLVRVIPVALALMAAGLAWMIRYPDPYVGWSLSDIPVADGLYCLGFVLLLLRAYPDFSWVGRIGWLNALIAAVNNRAMTIYLWSTACIFAALALIEQVPVLEPIVAGPQWQAHALVLTLTWVLIGLVVLALGWVEDVAAKRPVQFLPVPRRTGRHARVVPGPASAVVAPSAVGHASGHGLLGHTLAHGRSVGHAIGHSATPEPACALASQVATS